MALKPSFQTALCETALVSKACSNPRWGSLLNTDNMVLGSELDLLHHGVSVIEEADFVPIPPGASFLILVEGGCVIKKTSHDSQCLGSTARRTVSASSGTFNSVLLGVGDSG